MISDPFFLTGRRLQKVDGTAAGVGNVTIGTFDLSSGGLFDTITMLVLLGTVVDAGTLRLRAYTCDDSGGTNPDLIDDITGAEAQTDTVTTSTSSDKVMVLSVHRPKVSPTTGLGPFVQFVLERATQNTTVDAYLAVLESSREDPVAISSGILTNGTQKGYALGLQQ